LWRFRGKRQIGHRVVVLHWLHHPVEGRPAAAWHLGHGNAGNSDKIGKTSREKLISHSAALTLSAEATREQQKMKEKYKILRDFLIMVA